MPALHCARSGGTDRVYGLQEDVGSMDERDGDACCGISVCCRGLGE
jgi:hypothetical protein